MKYRFYQSPLLLAIIQSSYTKAPPPYGKPGLCCVIGRALRLGNHVNLALEALGVLHRAGNHREQGVILAATNVLARMEVRAALANEDLARVHDLTGKTLAA